MRNHTKVYATNKLLLRRFFIMKFEDSWKAPLNSLKPGRRNFMAMKVKVLLCMLHSSTYSAVSKTTSIVLQLNRRRSYYRREHKIVAKVWMRCQVLDWDMSTDFHNCVEVILLNKQVFLDIQKKFLSLTFVVMVCWISEHENSIYHKRWHHHHLVIICQFFHSFFRKPSAIELLEGGSIFAHTNT